MSCRFDSLPSVRVSRLRSASASVSSQSPTTTPIGGPSAPEPHLRNIRQLTFGGENAEAYFSPDGRQLIFQSTRDGAGCDQQFVMNVDGIGPAPAVVGRRPDDLRLFLSRTASRVLYASTHERRAVSAAAFVRRAATSGRSMTATTSIARSSTARRCHAAHVVRRATTPKRPSRADGRIVFTSVRDGDMEIYSMNGDGSDVRRLDEPAGTRRRTVLLARRRRGSSFAAAASRPGPSSTTIGRCSRQGLWRPTSLELFVMDRDGSNPRQVTTQWRRELRALLHARRRAHHLRVEPAQSEGAATSICS